jgi:hypothetical protein
MCPYLIAPPEPTAIDERVGTDVALLSELVATGVEVDGQVQVADSTWILYGHISYDGEIAIGVYQDADEAAQVLRAAPRGRSDPNSLVP